MSEKNVAHEVAAVQEKEFLDERSREYLQELLALYTALRESLTADTLREIIRLGGSLAEMADRLNRPESAQVIHGLAEHGEVLAALLQRAVRLEESGLLQRAEEMLVLLSALLDAVTPEIIAGLIRAGTRVMETADEMWQSSSVQRMPQMVRLLDSMMQDPPQRAAKGAFRYWMQTMRDPDIQDGLELFLALLRRIGRWSRQQAERNEAQQ